MVAAHRSKFGAGAAASWHDREHDTNQHVDTGRIAHHNQHADTAAVGDGDGATHGHTATHRYTTAA